MRALLSVTHLSRAFGGLRALRGVSLEVAAGEIVGVIGPNGAGKSTLFGAIAGSIRPDAGKVLFDGRDITGWPPERVARSGLAKTFQTTRLFPSLSFLDNVAVGALARHATMPAAREAALRCLDVVGLGDRRDASGGGASTGQRKRLEIARALATDPRLLLLDEPFGGVDVVAVDGLIDLLARIRANGITVMVIEHDLDAVHRVVDRLIAMNLGEKVAEGAADEVVQHPDVVRAYLGAETTADA